MVIESIETDGTGTDLVASVVSQSDMENILLWTTKDLNFAAHNKNNEAILYITNDPTLNDLTFTLANNTGKTLTFTGGEPVPEDTEKGSSCIYVFMDRLLFNQDIARIQLDAQSQQDWNLKHYSFDEDKAYLAISRRHDKSQNYKELLEFKLTNITTQHKKVSSEIDMSQQRIEGLKPSRFKQSILFMVTTLPDPQDKDLREVLTIGISGSNQVYISEKAETFPSPPINFKFLNTKDEPLVRKSKPWMKDSPRFRLKFSVTDQYTPWALTTADLAKNIIVNPEIDKSSKWKVVSDVSDPTPSWELQPQRDQNHEILGTVEVMLFIVDDIVTRFKPGSALMYIDYFNIPGYRDGTYVILLERVHAKPNIQYFDYEVNQKAPGTIPEIILEWTCYYGKKCSLFIGDKNVGDDFPLKGAYSSAYPGADTYCRLECIGGRESDIRWIPLEINFNVIMNVVGNGNRFLCFDGTTWNKIENTVGQNISGPSWGTGTHSIYAASGSENPFLMHFDGKSWTKMKSPQIKVSLRGMWGSDENNIYAVGGYTKSTILRYDGDSWIEMNHPPSYVLFSIWGSGPNDVYAVGIKSRGVSQVLHFDGKQWIEVNVPWGFRFDDVWGSGPNDVFAVGQEKEANSSRNLILHYDGNTWTRMSSIGESGLQGIWGSASDNVFAVSTSGNILHFDGKNWRAMKTPCPDAQLCTVWGNSANNVFTVGWQYYVAQGCTRGKALVLHYNGNTWNILKDELLEPLDEMKSEQITGIFGYSEKMV